MAFVPYRVLTTPSAFPFATHGKQHQNEVGRVRASTTGCCFTPPRLICIHNFEAALLTIHGKTSRAHCHQASRLQLEQVERQGVPEETAGVIMLNREKRKGGGGRGRGHSTHDAGRAVLWLVVINANKCGMDGTNTEPKTHYLVSEALPRVSRCDQPIHHNCQQQTGLQVTHHHQRTF